MSVGRRPIWHHSFLPPGKIKYLTLTDPYKVWMPDLFFSNEREGHFHDIIVPNVYVRIFPNGAVLYSIRYVDSHNLQPRLLQNGDTMPGYTINHVPSRHLEFLLQRQIVRPVTFPLSVHPNLTQRKTWCGKTKQEETQRWNTSKFTRSASEMSHFWEKLVKCAHVLVKNFALFYGKSMQTCGPLSKSWWRQLLDE